MNQELAKDLFIRLLSEMDGSIDIMKDRPLDRPEWSELFRTAAIEATQQDRPIIERMFAREIATRFSVEELRIGVVFLRGPAGQGLLDSLDPDESTDQAGAKQSKTEPATAAFLKSRLGHDFFEKLRDFWAILDSFDSDTTAIVMPELASRFAAKIEANETARHRSAPTAPEAPTPDSEALGLRLAHALLPSLDLKGIAGRMEAFDQLFDQYKQRPEWPNLFKEAYLETMDQNAPAIERAAGHGFANQFTPEELNAGAKFFEGPTGQAFLHYMAEKSAGRPLSPVSPEVRSKIADFMNTPQGRGVMDKLSSTALSSALSQADLLVPLIVGTFRRFGEKARLNEAAHHSDVH